VTKAFGMGGVERGGPRPGKSFLRAFIGIAALLVLITAMAGDAILDAAGRFLAPRFTGKADVLIIEGEELLQEGAVAEALKLMSERHIERLVLVTHRYSEARMGFGISQRYGRLVGEELEKAGLKKPQYILVPVPVAHPITLTEARAVLDTLSKESVKSAILIARGFHTRRSYLLYRDLGRTKGITIIPWSSSVDYPLTKWWRNEDAVVDFVAQLAKLSYYLVRGHIPISSLFQNP
jgi:hypothetical protein